MYVVPGADSWLVGPGARIGASFTVQTGSEHEIRMFSPTLPSEELELLVVVK